MIARVAMKTLILLSCSWLIVTGAFFPGGATAGDPQTIEVKVKAGDNLYDICNIYLESFRDWPKVAEINGLKDPGKVYPGQSLKIPINLLQGTTLPGLVAFIAGEVMYRSRSIQQWVAIQKGDQIYPGDSIRTGAMSSAEIRLGTGHSILLRQNTELTLSNSRNLSGFHKIINFFLNTGRVILKVRDSTGKGSRYEIQTPSAVAAARGTRFRTAVDTAENMRCEVLGGSVAVTALGGKVQVHALQGTVVKKGHAPLSPVKLLPAPAIQSPKTLYRSLPLKLEFSTVVQAVRYRVELSRQKDFKELVRDKTAAAGSALLLRDLEDGTYYLRSRSIDSRGLEGPSSDPVRFALRANPLAPYIQAPKAGARIYGAAVSFDWMRVSDAASYHLQVAEDSAFQNLVADIEPNRNMTHHQERLSPGAYHLRIRSIAADGYRGEWGGPLSFTISPLPVPPQGGETKMGKQNIEVQWRNSGPGFHYRIQVAREESFSTLIVDEKTSRSAFSFKRPESAGIYYLRISTVDSHGVEGKFSTPQSFEVQNPYVQWIPLVMIIVLVAIGL